MKKKLENFLLWTAWEVGHPIAIFYLARDESQNHQTGLLNIIIIVDYNFIIKTAR